MHFEIEPAWKPGMKLNQTQIRSPKFTRQPRIFATVIKANMPPLRVSLEGMLAILYRVRELVIADAIKVWKVLDGTRYTMTLPMLTEAELFAPYPVNEAVDPPAPPPIPDPEPVQESTTPVPVEPPPPLTNTEISEIEPVAADPAPETPVMEAVIEPPATPAEAAAPKGKKGKKAKEQKQE